MPRINASQSTRKFGYELQTKHFAQAPPVTNTWYTLFDSLAITSYLGGLGLNKTRIYRVLVYQNNGESATKDMEIELSIDGLVVDQVFMAVVAGASNDLDLWLRVEALEPPPYFILALNVLALEYIPISATNFLDFNRLFKLRGRITEAVGTAQKLNCTVMYGEQV